MRIKAHLGVRMLDGFDDDLMNIESRDDNMQQYLSTEQLV